MSSVNMLPPEQRALLAWRNLQDRHPVYASIAQGTVCGIFTSLGLAVCVFALYVTIVASISGPFVVYSGEESAIDPYVPFILLALAAVVIVGGAPVAFMLGRPWWSGVISVPVSGVIAFPISMTVNGLYNSFDDQSGYGFILILLMGWFWWFLLIEVCWSPDDHWQQVCALCLVGPPLTFLSLLSPSLPWLLLWWCAACMVMPVCTLVSTHVRTAWLLSTII